MKLDDANKLATAAGGELRLQVNPFVTPGRIVLGGSALHPALCFHSNEELKVWLDGLREQGLKEQRLCQCGHVFDAACGVNGCPNCHNEALT